MAKIIASLLFGLAVAVICVLSMWWSTGSQYYNNHARVSWTRDTMRSLGTSIETYFIDHGAFPPAIIALDEYPKVPADDWGNLVDYKVTYSDNGKSSYTLTSYGRDGKAGGRNMYERDIVYGTAQTPEDGDDVFSDDLPSFAQFVQIKYTHKPLWACLAAGVVSFLLSLRILPLDFQWQRAAVQRAGGYLVIVVVAALFVTYVLGAIHVPSTH